jgi:uncharacterized protein
MKEPVPCVIDANIFVSGTLSSRGPSGEILRQWRASHDFVTIVSRTLLQEICHALSKPKIVERYQVTEVERRRLVRQLYVRSIFVSPATRLRICRDPHDDYLIESAILGRAAYLVTEDPDLTEDQRIQEALQVFGVRVVRAVEFLGILKSGHP